MRLQSRQSISSYHLYLGCNYMYVCTCSVMSVECSSLFAMKFACQSAYLLYTCISI